MTHQKKAYVLIFTFILLVTCFISIPVIGFGAVVILDRTSSDYARQVNWGETKQSMEVSNTSSEFKLINKLQKVYSYEDIFSDGTSAIIVGSFHENEVSRLMNIDIETGGLNWQACETQTMILGENHVYVSYNEFSGGFVTAYRVDGGIEVWRTKIGNDGVSDIEITPIGLLVTTNDRGKKRYYLLNENDGQIRKSFKDQYALNDFFIQNGQNIFKLTDRGVASSGIHNWETKLNELPYRPTIKTIHRNDIVLIDVRDHFLSQIVALDSETGTILWQTQRNIKSNLAVENNNIYFLTEDASLLAVDLMTGHVLGQVEFSPSFKEMVEFDFVNTYPRVSVDNGIVVVYFDNARQLFAFSFSPKE